MLECAPSILWKLLSNYLSELILCASVQTVSLPNEGFAVREAIFCPITRCSMMQPIQCPNVDFCMQLFSTGANGVPEIFHEAELCHADLRSLFNVLKVTVRPLHVLIAASFECLQWEKNSRWAQTSELHTWSNTLHHYRYTYDLVHCVYFHGPIDGTT